MGLNLKFVKKCCIVLVCIQYGQADDIAEIQHKII